MGKLSKFFNTKEKSFRTPTPEEKQEESSVMEAVKKVLNVHHSARGSLEELEEASVGGNKLVLPDPIEGILKKFLKEKALTVQEIDILENDIAEYPVRMAPLKPHVNEFDEFCVDTLTCS